MKGAHSSIYQSSHTLVWTRLKTETVQLTREWSSQGFISVHIEFSIDQSPMSPFICQLMIVSSNHFGEAERLRGSLDYMRLEKNANQPIDFS